MPNGKIIGGIAVIIIVFVVIAVLFPLREGPNVVFVSEDKIFVDFVGVGQKSFKVNIENREDKEIDGIKVQTKLHNPDPTFIKIVTPEIDIGKLNQKARSGEKDVIFQVLRTTGDVIKFSGNSTVIIDGLKPSIKEFEITIKPLQ